MEKARSVLTLTGIAGVRAFNVFHHVILGMKMLPINLEKGYEAFLGELHEKEDQERKKFFVSGLRFVPLEDSDIEAVLKFCLDSNGVPLCRANTKSMAAQTIIEHMADVFVEISKINVDLVTDEEKKNLKTSQST